MPIYKKIRIRKPLVRSAYYQRRRMMYMRRRNAIRNKYVVAETWAHRGAPVLLGNNGYSLGFAAADCPQFNAYSTLYRRFRVKKAQFTLVPQLNVAQVAGGNPSTLFRVTYAVQDTPGSAGAPANENVVLEDNGCKIKPIVNNPIKITFYPKPDLASVGAQAQFPAFSQKKLYWLNTTNPENLANGTGEAVNHYGVDLWCAGQLNTAACAVFIKVWFEFADPA